MYKVNTDGTISCDSPEEALRLQELMLKRQGRSAPVSVTQTAARYSLFDNLHRAANPTNVSSSTNTFLSSLHNHQGKILDSDQMAKLLGTDSPTAVGPKLRAVRNQLQSMGSTLDNYLTPEKRPNGTTVWLVNERLSSTEKSG